MEPYYEEGTTKDWPHLDQTMPIVNGDPARTIQGQAVMSNSTACFRCSPRSHRVYTEITELTKENWERAGVQSNWNFFKPHQIDQIKEMVEAVGGSWQVPVQAERGAVILWLSTLIHSARMQLPGPIPTSWPGKWAGWRGVAYVCWRPRTEVDQEHLDRLKTSMQRNLCTNHGGEKLFEPQPRRVPGSKVQTPSKLLELIKDPTLVYTRFPELCADMSDPKIQALM